MDGDSGVDAEGRLSYASAPRHERWIMLVGVALLVVGAAAAVTSAAMPDLLPETALSIFEPDEEQSLITWYSSAVLGMAGVVASICSLAQRTQRREWRIVALALALMSLDEVAGFHERAGYVLERLLDVSRFLWVVPGAIVAVTAVAIAVPFLRQLAPRVRRSFVSGAALFVAGALGVEAVTGLVYESGGSQSLTYALLTVVEESLEVSGALLFLHAALTVLRDVRASLHLTFTEH